MMTQVHLFSLIMCLQALGRLILALWCCRRVRTLETLDFASYLKLQEEKELSLRSNMAVTASLLLMKKSSLTTKTNSRDSS